MKKIETIFSDKDHKWSVIARDATKPSYLIDTNEYLIESDGIGLLTDPGGSEIFPEVFSALCEVFAPSHLKMIFASHQDPDIISSIALWLEVNPEIKCYTYPGSANLSCEYFVDMDGILRTIDQHPLYFIVPFVEKVAWRSWQDPTRITTSSRKLIHKIKGIHYFVPSFDQVKFYYKQPIHKNSRRILNPDFFQLPLTNSQLQQYHLVNDTAAH